MESVKTKKIFVDNIIIEISTKKRYSVFKLPKLKFLETSIFRFFPKFKKLNISLPPGEPREHHLGDVRPKNVELHKIS